MLYVATTPKGGAPRGGGGPGGGGGAGPLEDAAMAMLHLDGDAGSRALSFGGKMATPRFSGDWWVFWWHAGLAWRHRRGLVAML